MKILEDKKDDVMTEEEDPCESGYDMVGMKTQNGRKVPNCVPEDELDPEDRIY